MKALLGFIAGILSGVLILEGLIVLLGRKGSFGGEVLIIPLIVLLIAFGWDMGKENGYRKGMDKGFGQGYEERYFEGSHAIYKLPSTVKNRKPTKAG